MFDWQQLQLAAWDRLPARECERIAAELLPALGSPWAFDRVRHEEMGDQARWVAFFWWLDVEFALIPGGHAVLGYDRSRPFYPQGVGALDWWGDGSPLPVDFSELNRDLDDCLSSYRVVDLEPFLIETSPKPYQGGLPVKHSEIILGLAEHGFLLPSLDQWEYACAAGSRTLYRWGNSIPTEQEIKRGWDRDERPNAFGLRFLSSSYPCELCAEPGVLKGGDLGTLGHGGATPPFLFLPQASAFEWPPRTRRGKLRPEDPEYGGAWRESVGLYFRMVHPLRRGTEGS